MKVASILLASLGLIAPVVRATYHDDSELMVRDFENDDGYDMHLSIRDIVDDDLVDDILSLYAREAFLSRGSGRDRLATLGNARNFVTSNDLASCMEAQWEIYRKTNLVESKDSLKEDEKKKIKDLCLSQFRKKSR